MYITEDSQKHYLVCEHKAIFYLLMMASGMVGAYTYNMRGGVFCNAQTANLMLMGVKFGKGEIADAIYYFIPFAAYFLGTVVSEWMPSPIRKWHFLRWDTWLLAFEILVMFIVGFIPLTWSHHIVQVIINFVASMQYNTFRQAEGIPMATTFCTNHVRQIGIACAKYFRKHDTGAVYRGETHIIMLACFVSGCVILTIACQYLFEKAIWIAIIPLFIAFSQLVKADLTVEHDYLDNKPSGH